MSVKVLIKSDSGIISLLDDYYSSFNNEGWIDCDFKITIDCFYVSLSTQLYKADLELFLTSVVDSIDNKTRKLSLDTIEEFFNLEGDIQDNGSIKWKGKIRSTSNSNNVLFFSFESDKNQLNELCVTLSDILKRVS